jgi:hypothetical protein
MGLLTSFSLVDRAANLVVTARDIFEMYRAVVPVHHGDKLENVPTLGMLFHNDCMYMAHVLLTLGHTQRAKLPEDVRPLVSFVDMVIPLRKLAEHYYFIQMVRHRCPFALIRAAETGVCY